VSREYDLTAVVFVIDDDPSMRAAIEDLVGSVALAVRPFASPQEFLASKRPDARAAWYSMCDCQG